MDCVRLLVCGASAGQARTSCTLLFQVWCEYDPLRPVCASRPAQSCAGPREGPLSLGWPASLKAAASRAGAGQVPGYGRLPRSAQLPRPQGLEHSRLFILIFGRNAINLVFTIYSIYLEFSTNSKKIRVFSDGESVWVKKTCPV